MSKYQELSKTFAESVQLQAKYVSDCCEFSNFFFSQMAEYLEWPKDQMAFAHDESLHTEGPMCNSNSARLRDDGNIHFFALFTINRFDNENHHYQLIFPFKVKKLEDSFLLTITGLVEEVLLSTEDTQEMKNVYENSPVVFCHFWYQCGTLRPYLTHPHVKGATPDAASNRGSRSPGDCSCGRLPGPL